MCRLLVLLSILIFAACSNDRADNVNSPGSAQAGQPAQQPDRQPSPPLEPAPEQPAEAPAPSPKDTPALTMTPQECQAAGGTFRPSLGGAIECEPGESKIAQVVFGIEGGVCCR
jgi:hypothetical protein